MEEEKSPGERVSLPCGITIEGLWGTLFLLGCLRRDKDPPGNKLAFPLDIFYGCPCTRRDVGRLDGIEVYFYNRVVVELNLQILVPESHGDRLRFGIDGKNLARQVPYTYRFLLFGGFLLLEVTTLPGVFSGG